MREKKPLSYARKSQTVMKLHCKQHPFKEWHVTSTCKKEKALNK